MVSTLSLEPCMDLVPYFTIFDLEWCEPCMGYTCHKILIFMHYKIVLQHSVMFEAWA